VRCDGGWIAYCRRFAAVLECAGRRCEWVRLQSAVSAHVMETSSVVVPSTSAVLTGEIDLRMHDAHVACQCIVT